MLFLLFCFVLLLGMPIAFVIGIIGMAYFAVTSVLPMVTSMGMDLVHFAVLMAAIVTLGS
jgi:hypothetical protein